MISLLKKTASLLFVSSFAFAASPTLETKQLARLLINNPDVVSQLQKNTSPLLTSFEVKEVMPGVQQFNLSFKRECYCMPSTANVTIVEDMTPTYSDGLPVYNSKVEIKSGF